MCARPSDAWAAVANVAFSRQIGGWLPPGEAQQIGHDAALRAVKSDPENPSALSIAAATLGIQGGSVQQAIEFADRALELTRNSAPVLTFCAFPYNFDGQTETALALLKAARRLSPFDPRSYVIYGQMAHSYLFSHRFDEAADCAARAADANSSYLPGRRYLAASLGLAGRIEEARRAIEDLLEIQPNARLSLSRTNALRHRWMVDLFNEGLQRAGLPE